MGSATPPTPDPESRAWVEDRRPRRARAFTSAPPPSTHPSASSRVAGVFALFRSVLQPLNFGNFASARALACLPRIENRASVGFPFESPSLVRPLVRTLVHRLPIHPPSVRRPLSRVAARPSAGPSVLLPRRGPPARPSWSGRPFASGVPRAPAVRPRPCRSESVPPPRGRLHRRRRASRPRASRRRVDAHTGNVKPAV